MLMRTVAEFLKRDLLGLHKISSYILLHADIKSLISTSKVITVLTTNFKDCEKSQRSE